MTFVRGFVPLATLFIVLRSSEAAVQHTIDWIIPMSPQTLTISVGDSVRFEWMSTHNVYLSASESDFSNCVTTGGTELSRIRSDGFFETVLVEIGTYYYICSYGSHCDRGQKIAVTVEATADPVTPVPSPPPSRPPPPPPCFPSSALG